MLLSLDYNLTPGDKKEKKKGIIQRMYTCMNTNEGLPPRLYRSPTEIHRDMAVISRRIRENEEMLSVHNLLIEMIPLWAAQFPHQRPTPGVNLAKNLPDAQGTAEA